MGLEPMILFFRMLSFKSIFSLSSYTECWVFSVIYCLIFMLVISLDDESLKIQDQNWPTPQGFMLVVEFIFLTIYTSLPGYICYQLFFSSKAEILVSWANIWKH